MAFNSLDKILLFPHQAGFNRIAELSTHTQPLKEFSLTGYLHISCEPRAPVARTAYQDDVVGAQIDHVTLNPEALTYFLPEVSRFCNLFFYFFIFAIVKISFCYYLKIQIGICIYFFILHNKTFSNLQWFS